MAEGRSPDQSFILAGSRICASVAEKETDNVTRAVGACDAQREAAISTRICECPRQQLRPDGGVAVPSGAQQRRVAVGRTLALGIVQQRTHNINVTGSGCNNKRIRLRQGGMIVRKQ